MTMIRVQYPASYSKLSTNDMKLLLEMWTRIFKDYQAEKVYSALETYISTPGKEFAPKPGDLIGIIESDGDESGFEAWSLVERTLSSKLLTWDPVSAFYELPDDIRATVGGAQQLVTWSRMPEKELPFIKREFLAKLKKLRAEGIPEQPPRKQRKLLTGGGMTVYDRLGSAFANEEGRKVLEMTLEKLRKKLEADNG